MEEVRRYLAESLSASFAEARAQKRAPPSPQPDKAAALEELIELLERARFLVKPFASLSVAVTALESAVKELKKKRPTRGPKTAWERLKDDPFK